MKRNTTRSAFIFPSSEGKSRWRSMDRPNLIVKRLLTTVSTRVRGIHTSVSILKRRQTDTRLLNQQFDEGFSKGLLWQTRLGIPYPRGNHTKDSFGKPDSVKSADPDESRVKIYNHFEPPPPFRGETTPRRKASGTNEG